MNVAAGTSTSSPGPISMASSASRSASRPLASPTHSATPTYSANARSNSATAGPFVNAPVDMLAERSERTPSWIGSKLLLRSMNGTSTEASDEAVSRTLVM